MFLALVCGANLALAAPYVKTVGLALVQFDLYSARARPIYLARSWQTGDGGAFFLNCLYVTFWSREIGIGRIENGLWGSFYLLFTAGKCMVIL